MDEPLSLKTETWLNAPETRAVMEALTSNGGEARFVGGCVRNALIGAPVEDIDIATPLPPDEVDQADRGRGAARGADRHRARDGDGDFAFEAVRDHDAAGATCRPTDGARRSPSRPIGRRMPRGATSR